MRFQSLLPIAAAGLAACSSSDAGVLTHGIIAGQNQTAIAGSARLTDAVVEGIAKTSDGRISMHRVDPERVLDLVVPRAFAQGTVVRGSPVAGAVVCIGDAQGLTAFVPCTNTDVNGLATFFFTPSTKAGLHTAEVRGTVAGAPMVFDTARATVVAGPPDPNMNFDYVAGPSPATIPLGVVSDAYANGVAFRIVTDGRLTVTGEGLGTAAARTVTFTSAMLDTLYRGPLEFRGINEVVVARAKYQIIINNDRPEIIWRVRGTALVP